MTPLPRGICPICGRDVALRKGELVREHRDPLAEATCRGSGMLRLGARLAGRKVTR